MTGSFPKLPVKPNVAEPAKRNVALAKFVILAGAAVVVAATGIAVLHRTAGVTSSIEAKILGIAFAVGLDVLALSIAVGIIQLPWAARIRLGLAFSSAEVGMQLVGYVIGNDAGRIIGTVAIYAGFAVLAAVGAFIIRESYSSGDDLKLKIDSGWGLVAVCASVSLDSLGIGVSLPGVPLPLVPLLSTVAVSTVVFTGIGLAFGAQLGERYKRIAERTAGIVLVVLAAFFTLQHIAGYGA